MSTTKVKMPPATSIRSSFRQWWKGERAENAYFDAIRNLAQLGCEFLRESLPERHRQRYGDVEYDWEFRVDTTSATVGWRTRLLGLLHSPYQPVPPEQFREIVAELPINFGDFTFVDMGSGKGRALLLASECGFRRIIGIELLPELDRIARENIRKFQDRGRGAAIELLCEDAAEFNFPADPTVVFLFNPLPKAGLRELFKTLESSLRENPRPLYVVYVNPLHKETIASCALLTKVGGNHQYCVYAS